MDDWIILALGVILYVLRYRRIAMNPIQVPLLKFSMKAITNGISVTSVATVQIQPWGFIYPIPKNVQVYKLFTFHIIFLILWLLLEIYNLTVTRVWFKPRADPEIIIHVWLSISDQLFCKIKIVSLWSHLNIRPNCVII